MKKVLMVVQNNFTNDSRVLREAYTLGQNGYIVKVVALYSPGLKRHEDKGCFNIERVYLSSRERLSKKNRYIQLVKYAEFYKKCLSIGREFRPDIIHVHDLSPLPIGVRLKKRLGCKLIYDSHELWSQSSSVASTPFILNRARDIYERHAINCADAIITVSKSIARYLEKEYGLDRPVEVIRNIPAFVSIEKKHNLFRRIFPIAPEEKILLYQGGVAKGRGIEQIITAMHLINPDTKLVVLGDGFLIPSMQKIVDEKKLQDRVFFHEAVAIDVLYEYTNSADIGISLIQNTCLSYYFSLPNKVFEFIQAEVPVICSNFPDMRELVEQYKVGIVVRPEEPASIARVVNELMGCWREINEHRKMCKLAKKNINWESEERILLSIYDRL